MCRWDEWVPASRLLKFNEQNLALQKQLNASAKEASASAASTSKASKVGVGRDGGRLSTLGRKEGARGTKRGRDEVSCVRDVFFIRRHPWCLRARTGRQYTQAGFEAECARHSEGEARRRLGGGDEEWASEYKFLVVKLTD